MSEQPGTRWPQGSGAAYAKRFADLAATGRDLHGEARFVAGLVEPGARVLDAGCGTGRIAVELARRGYSCVGLDVDASMLAEAQRADPGIRWVEADLADPTLTLTAGDGEPFDLVLCAGKWCRWSRRAPRPPRWRPWPDSCVAVGCS